MTTGETCYRCGHEMGMHTWKCQGNTMSGGPSGMLQQCGCTAFITREAWEAEKNKK